MAENLRLEFPDELPITAHVDEIRSLIETDQVLVVAGETGSGKTTQLPKICLAAGLGAHPKRIAHTQPRRLAARAVAGRIAEEMGVALGAEVGYAVRFNEMLGDDTRVKLLTDGLLLTEIRRDKLLRRYDAIIVDEAHERSLNIDFLLGYLKRLLKKRSDLNLIVTSATIDVAALSEYFDGAPVVEVGGRTYPVDVRYLQDADLGKEFDEQLLDCITDIETGPASRARDILAFLPGEREIMDTAQLLRRELPDAIEVLPLYARLSAKDQQRVFRPGKKRRIVLATNVAETSLTVPNIGYVIDQGVARISRYSFRSKLQRLPVEPVSQASANQRAGRCGRIAPGVCFRLYTREDFEGRADYTDPEIKRTNLASVVLQMRAFSLGEPLSFPFLDPPDPRAVRDAEKLLVELGALNEDTGRGKLTDVGRRMARLPVDPRLARMLIKADQTRSLSELLVIVSALAVADPRERPVEKQGSADRAHARWIDPRSDFLAFLNLWRWFQAARETMTRSALRRELGRQFLNSNRMREWLALHRQLLLVVKEYDMRVNREEADYASIHQALLAGSLSLIGRHDERGHYEGPRNLGFRIFPGSAMAERTPKWLVAAEITETRRVYARCVASVEARWIEDAGQRLLKRRHSEPHWSLNRGEAIAFETVTLYGLLLADRRRVSYSKIDADASRSLFLVEGLAAGAIKQPPEFLLHNLNEAKKVRELEDKGRRRDLLLNETAVGALYDELIPREICTVNNLNHWLRRASADEIGKLFFTADQLCQDSGVIYAEEDFPGTLKIRNQVFDLKYRFAPGQQDDGVSLQVPMGMLGALAIEALEWSIPGLFGGVCEQWVRTLPKQKRRVLAPVPDSIAQVLPILLQPGIYRQGRLSVALGKVVQAEFGVSIAASDWDRGRVDPHWLMNVQVLDDRGRVKAQSRDAKSLQAGFAAEVENRMKSGLRERHEEAGLKDFPESGIAETTQIGRSGDRVVAYPALVDEGDSVGLRFLLDPARQALENREGYSRLALLKVGQTARFMGKRLSADKSVGLLYAPLGNSAQLKDELLKASAWQCFFEGMALPADSGSFNTRITERKSELVGGFERIVICLKIILKGRIDLLGELDAVTSPAFAPAVSDIRHQIEVLVPARVLTLTPGERLAEIPRYIEAARYRLRNLQGKVGRDREQAQMLEEFEQRIRRLEGQAGMDRADWETLRFTLEEVRVGVFAEKMGVRGRVSPKRLDQQLLEVERELGIV